MISCEIRYSVFDRDFLCVLIVQFVCVLLLMCVIFFTCLPYTDFNGLEYGDKPGGFCQMSRECRSGAVQSHKLPTPGGEVLVRRDADND